MSRDVTLCRGIVEPRSLPNENTTLLYAQEVLTHFTQKFTIQEKDQEFLDILYV